MRSSVFVTAMMAMAVSASPALKIIEEVVTKTVTLKPGEHAPTAAPKVAPVPAAAPAPKPASNNGGGFLQSHPQPAPSSGNNPYLPIANKYRALYGLPELSWDESMIPNCQTTGGNGKDENHIMIPNMAMGQVITPGLQVPFGDLGGLTPFEVAYNAWLCEVPDGRLGNNCNIVQRVTPMTYGGDTGHWKILTDPSYTKLACFFTPKFGQLDPNQQFQGLYVCDLAQ